MSSTKRKNARRRRTFSLEILEARRLLATYTVNTVIDDVVNADCVTTLACSLRAAINESNKLASPHLIRFQIPDDGPHRLMIDSPLPVIRKQVTLDATTQLGIGTGPQIELDGLGIKNILGSSDSGLLIQSGSTIRGFSIVNFPGYGIYVASGTNNVIVGNYIGVRADGVTIAGNGRGEGSGDDVKDGIGLLFSANNQIGGPGADANLIMGNVRSGIMVYGDDSYGNRIQQNSIFANGGPGIRLLSDNSGGGTTKPGPNANQPSPVLTSAVVRNGELRIDFNTNFAPNRSYEIEVFHNPADSSAGDATTFLRQRIFPATNPAPSTGFLTMPFPGPITGTISLTTTDLTNNNTSEISLPITVTNDNLPQMSVLDAGTTEGGELLFDVHLSRAVNATVEVLFSTANVTAMAGSDYIAKTQTVTFLPNQTKKTVTVTTLDNGTVNDGEGDESFRVQLSNPVNADLLDSMAIGRILDNDAPSGTLPAGAELRDLASFMIGKVYVNVVFVESTGFGSDPNLEDWTTSQIASQKQDIQAGLNWWKEVFNLQDSQHQLDFEIDWHLADNPLQTPLEFVHAPSLKTRDMLVGELTRYYNVSQTAFPHTDYRNLLQQQRIEHGTDWVTTIFVLDNSSTKIDLEQIDGGVAELYVIQPADIFRSSTAAHEFGHVFYATDQYAPSFNATATSNLCGNTAGYYNTPNSDSSDCNTPKVPTSPSIMNELSNEAFNLKQISPSTAKMIGWRDSDNDGIFDVLDQPLELRDLQGNFNATSGMLQITGSANATKLPNQNPSPKPPASPRPDITLNRVQKIQARVKGSEQPWQTIQIANGSDVQINASFPGVPSQTIQVRAMAQLDDIISSGNDEISIAPSPVLTANLLATSIVESGSTTLLISRSGATDAAMTVSVFASMEDQLTFSESILIPQGAMDASLTLSSIDNLIATGSRDVVLSISAPTAISDSVTLRIEDNETPSLALTASSFTIHEGGIDLRITVSRNTPVGQSTTVSIQGSAGTGLIFPTEVIIAANDVTQDFFVSVTDNAVANGDRNVTLTATSPGFDSATATLTVTDDEVAALGLTIVPLSISENGGTSTVTVTRNTPALELLTVNLSVDAADRVLVESSVVIPAGADSATFSVRGIDNTIVEPDQLIRVTASVDGFVSATSEFVLVSDDIPKLVIVETDESTFLSETGIADEFSVALDRQPLSDVVLNVNAIDVDGVVIQPATLTFTPGNWLMPQSVTLSVSDSFDLESGAQVTTRISIDSQTLAFGYDELGPSDLRVTVVDAVNHDLQIEIDEFGLNLVDAVTSLVLKHVNTDNLAQPLMLGAGHESVTIANSSGGPSILQLDLAGGDDWVTLLSLDVSSIDGGMGFDTVNVEASVARLDLTDTAIDLRNMEQIILGSGASQLLVLSPASVTRVSDDSNVLSVRTVQGSQIELQPGWKIAEPEIDADGFWHQLTSDGARIRIRNSTPWTNPLIRADVNGSGDVTASDALEIIFVLDNKLSDNSGMLVEPASIDKSLLRYYDPNLDGRATAADALLVINNLYLQSLGIISSEGEAFPYLASSMVEKHVLEVALCVHAEAHVETPSREAKIASSYVPANLNSKVASSQTMEESDENHGSLRGLDESLAMTWNWIQ